MRTAPVVQDVILGADGGCLATRVMEPVSAKLDELESDHDRAREDAPRPGPPDRIAARKITELVALHLSDPASNKAALGFHYGPAISWTTVYRLLRRATGLGPVAAGVATGASMSLPAEEGMTPALGFSAPNRAYPLTTHLHQP